MLTHNRIQGYLLITIKAEPPPPQRFPRLRMALQSPYQPAPSPEQVRLHALLNDRLFALQGERRGLWSKIRRFFWGD
jgi:hypothetical protein